MITLYNPEEYWHKRGADYQAEGEVLEAIEVENLEKAISQVASINTRFLEIGSGYGRIYNALKDQWYIFHSYSNYSMCDFAESMRYNCLRNTDILPDYWDGKTLPYSDRQFDFAISFSVLLHVQPDMIENVFAEHIRVCNKYLFIATYNTGLGSLASHCFEHDYKKLFREHGLKIVDEKFFQNGLRANWLLEV
jgi:SAM-dependent methyltransferase